MDRGELEDLDRESLVVRAQAAGIRRARILTRPELIDELLRLDPTTDDVQLRKSRGFFGRARDLVARVVERGLHLPDAADRIRTIAMGPLTLSVPRTEPQAMPTVTLAEIYAAQGHSQRAIETLRRVLEREPEHAAARALLARLEDEAYVAPPPRLPPEPEVEPAMAADADEGEPSITDDLTSTGDRDRNRVRNEVIIHDVTDAAIAAEAAAAAEAGGAVDDDDDDELTVQMGFRNRTIEGPSYGDANGAEFHLAPASDREPPGEDALDDPAYAPTRELPRGPGRTYTFVAPRGEPDVDAHAKTDVFEVVPESDPPDEIDECFAIPLGEGRTYVRWNVSFSMIGSLLGSMPRGRFVVRAHIVTPAWDGPNVETRDLAVDPDAGETTLRALPEPSVVRVAIGWLDGSTFVPLAHSPALETARGRGLVMWTTKGTVPVSLDDPRAAPIARALEASRRAQAHG